MSPKPLRSHEEIKAAAQESRVAKHAAQRKRGVSYEAYFWERVAKSDGCWVRQGWKHVA